MAYIFFCINLFFFVENFRLKIAGVDTGIETDRQALFIMEDSKEWVFENVF